MQRDMWSTMLILVPIMLEDNMARTSFLVKFESDLKRRDVQFARICNLHYYVPHQHGLLNTMGIRFTMVEHMFLCSLD